MGLKARSFSQKSYVRFIRDLRNGPQSSSQLAFDNQTPWSSDNKPLGSQSIRLTGKEVTIPLRHIAIHESNGLDPGT